MSPRWRIPMLAVLLALSGPAASAQDAGGSRTVVVGGDRSYPPYEFLDEDAAIRGSSARRSPTA